MEDINNYKNKYNKNKEVKDSSERNNNTNYGNDSFKFKYNERNNYINIDNNYTAKNQKYENEFIQKQKKK